jgi:hypothetical protein
MADVSETEAELREEFLAAFGRAEYPLADPFELVPLLPDGSTTEFRAGEVVVPAVELGTRYGDYQDFPYESVDALVDDVVAGLNAEGEL